MVLAVFGNDRVRDSDEMLSEYPWVTTNALNAPPGQMIEFRNDPTKSPR